MDENRKKNHPELVNEDPEKQMWYAFAYFCILAIKSKINKLPSMERQIVDIE